MEPPTAREVVARLEQSGFVYVGCRGDHRKYRKDGRTVIVPGNSASISRRDLAKRQAPSRVVTSGGHGNLRPPSTREDAHEIHL